MKKFILNQTDNFPVVVVADDSKAARKIWDLTDKVIQQISTQREDGEDPDIALLNINVSRILEV